VSISSLSSVTCPFNANDISYKMHSTAYLFRFLMLTFLIVEKHVVHALGSKTYGSLIPFPSNLLYLRLYKALILEVIGLNLSMLII
jgi:hypothetical protein